MGKEFSPIQNLRGQMGAVVAGVFLGWIPMLCAIVLLFWNEGRAVKTQRALSEGSTNVVSITVDQIAAANDHRLVHAQGLVTTRERLADPLFGVSVEALRLRRVVETYQWREREESQRQSSGSSRTKQVTYRYEQTWSDSLIDSSRFHDPVGRQNPTSIPFPSAEWSAATFELGAFRLEPCLREQVKGFTPLGVQVGQPDAQVLQVGFRPLTASFYRGDDPSLPKIGDVRVVFEAVQPTEVSVIAGQEGNALAAYQTKAGSQLALLSRGKLTATQMFRDEQRANVILLWAYRLGGYLLMLLGVRMVLRPISLLANFLPGFLKGLASVSNFIGFLFATAVTLMVAAFAWFAYRPQLSLSLLAIGVLLSALVVWNTRRSHRTQVA